MGIVGKLHILRPFRDDRWIEEVINWPYKNNTIKEKYIYILLFENININHIYLNISIYFINCFYNKNI